MDEHQNGDRSADQVSPPVIVAIGASAGGIRALQNFFDVVPAQTGAAFVVVVHLDPDRPSDLPHILDARSEMPVVLVGWREHLAADHIYVIPPDRRLELVDHELSAVPFDEPRGRRSPIDWFFRSLSEGLGDGFAIILSGAGSDGALGVRAVKEGGGIIFVQDPDEAEHPSMPRNAIATGIVDFVLPVKEIAARLPDLIRLKQSVSIANLPAADEDLLRQVLNHLRVRTGHDFSKYKRSTVLRRIARRMQVTRSSDLPGYLEVLGENGEEAQALLSDLLISVTTFFRDPEAFNTLRKSVLAKLFESRGPADSVRVWVCGCATGEETYSIAMLLLEEAGLRDPRPAIQVFGSDLDARALAVGREGRYPAAIEADVSEERLRRFFVREAEGYRVREELRDIVLFAVHDLLKDPPFSRLDLVTCRNVLIYLDRELQEQVCSTFHYALNPGGILMLGASESADSPAGFFRLLDRNARLYQSTAAPGDKPRLLPPLLGPIRVHEHISQFATGSARSSALSEAALHRTAIEAVAPPSILVDHTHRVVHLSDNAGRYLQPVGGPLSGDVVDLVRPELRFELRSALNRLFEQDHATLSLPIMVRFNGSPHRVHLQVKSAVQKDPAGRHALILFVEGEAVSDNAAFLEQHATDETVLRLTQELELMQARLRTVREESDAANEELRAANEELQSINEEYRSTSEELETSKEELQSINEELQTVNTELKLKLEAISRAHSDLQNLMAATDYGTLFLDAGLRIRRFTQRVTELFSITPLDEGRPITDFAHQLEHDGLVKDARAVLTDLAPIRREIRSRDGRWYDLRLRPYRTVEDKIDGVVITFVDISDRLKVEQALRESERQLRQQKRLVDLSHDPIFVWDYDAGILDWNRGSEELYGYSHDEAVGKVSDRLLGSAPDQGSFEDVRAALLRDGAWAGELRQKTKGGEDVTVECRVQLEVVDGRRLVLESTRDISEQKSWEGRQQLLLRELTHRVKNTLAIVQSIASLTLRTTQSPVDFVERFSARLEALSGAHGLLVQSDWRGADFASLARGQLAPYIADSPERARLEGPSVILPADLATPFGLVLHELAANAVKYGSLSAPDGGVEVVWAVEPGNHSSLLKVEWREVNGPKVKAPAELGFGTRLIDMALQGATVTRDYREDGFVCDIALPLAPLDSGGERR